MAPDEFSFLARLLRRRCGLSLTPDKKALTTRRLAPVMRRFDFKDMASLIGELRLGREALADAVTEAMTINESSFFRDAAMFRTLRETVLPRLAAARRGDKRLRIWSAACAAGQEATCRARLSRALRPAVMPIAKSSGALILMPCAISAANAPNGWWMPPCAVW
jgi:chemotaxis protein methyltransferase CheR